MKYSTNQRTVASERVRIFSMKSENGADEVFLTRFEKALQTQEAKMMTITFIDGSTLVLKSEMFYPTPHEYPPHDNQPQRAEARCKEYNLGNIQRAKAMISDCTSDSMLVINREVRKLKENGWLAPHPSTDKDYWLEMLEPESVGVHSGYCDEEGSYWVVDQVDCWPSDPMLVRRVGKKQLAVFEGDDNEESR